MKPKLITAIILLAALLRFFQLGHTPPGLYWDEVSLGYNAYSILKTGHDEHNEFLPYARFKAFGDYKPPGYIYATILSIALFGLNNFAVRFPSALAGTLTVLVTYFLVKQLFPKQKHYSLFTIRFSLADLSALLLAISPWHLQLSRVAFEANLACLLNALAVYLFLKSRQKPSLLIWSAISFVATMYTFNSNRLIAPLLVILLGIFYFKHLYKNLKPAFLAATIGFLLILPLIPHLSSSEGKLRWHEVNIFSDLDVILTSNSRIAADGGGLLPKLIHHRYIGHTLNFLKHYFDHFDGRYLFITGDGNPRFSIQEVGELYIIELPFLLLGLYALTRVKNKKSAIILLSWLILAPVPAAMARETPHALRTISILPTPHIIIALGIVYSFGLFKINYKYLFSAYLFLFLLSFTYFQSIYYFYFPKEFASEWLTSYPPLVNYLKNSQDAQNAQTVYVTKDLGRPYIYFLFYNQYPPQEYMKETNRTGDVFGFYQVHGFDKYVFSIPEYSDIKSGDIIVVRWDQTPDGFTFLKQITEINGRPQFNILKKQ